MWEKCEYVHDLIHIFGLFNNSGVTDKQSNITYEIRFLTIKFKIRNRIKCIIMSTIQNIIISSIQKMQIRNRIKCLIMSTIQNTIISSIQKMHNQGNENVSSIFVLLLFEDYFFKPELIIQFHETDWLSFLFEWQKVVNHIRWKLQKNKRIFNM